MLLSLDIYKVTNTSSRVVYDELVLTGKEYMREVLTIDPRWLIEVAPSFFKQADPNKISKRKRQEKLEPLFNRYEKADEWRLSKVKKSHRASQTCKRFFSLDLSILY